MLSAKFDAATCLVESLTSANNHIYANAVTDGGSIAIAAVSGGLDGADLSAANSDGLVSGQNADAGIGADTTKLHLILETEVGPNTTWTAN